MADVGAKNSQTETIRKLGSEIRTAMTAIANYEEGVVRLGDTAKDELISTMKKIVRDRKKTLQALEAKYETIAKTRHRSFIRGASRTGNLDRRSRTSCLCRGKGLGRL
jgi:hypothetical protein